MGPPRPPELSEGARVETMRYTSMIKGVVRRILYIIHYLDIIPQIDIFVILLVNL